MKKYKINVSNLDNEEDIREFTINDLKDFFIQCRGFPTILRLGSISGEGQSGGRVISFFARDLERQIVNDLGEEEYKKQMDKLMEG